MKPGGRLLSNLDVRANAAESLSLVDSCHSRAGTKRVIFTTSTVNAKRRNAVGCFGGDQYRFERSCCHQDPWHCPSPELVDKSTLRFDRKSVPLRTDGRGPLPKPFHSAMLYAVVSR